MINVDIPQLSSGGIIFGYECYLFTYSLQSSSTHSIISSSFDAAGLENYLNYGTMEPSSASTVVRDRTDLNSIPLDVENLWISRFDTSDVSEFSPSRFQSLKTLVIGNGLFWSVNRLELNNLTSLQILYIGNGCFGKVRVFELNGLSELESVVIGENSFRIDDDERNDGSYRIVNCPKLKSIQIGYESFRDYHSFEQSNLPSLQSIYIGSYCFKYAPSFSLAGLIDGLDLIHRSSSTTITQTCWWCIRFCSFYCV